MLKSKDCSLPLPQIIYVGFQIDSFEKFVVMGDRLLVKPQQAQQQTRSGLYLPASVEEKEILGSGYVIKTGPGYAIPSGIEDEPWKDPADKVQYIPLQIKVGDLAIYLRKQGYEIDFNGASYLIMPQSAVLMVIRDEDLLV